MEYIPIGLFWAIAFWGLASRKNTLVYMLMAFIPITSMAVIPTQLTAGVTVQCSTVIALFIIAKQSLKTSGIEFFANGLLSYKKFLLLFCFWVVATLVTLIAPRLFAGQITVVPLRTIPGIFKYSTLLVPTTQNITQIFYLTISIFSVFALTRLASDRRNRSLFLDALLVGGFITFLTGLLDFSSQFLPISPMLELFRTASYAIGAEVNLSIGIKRVVGLTPEASSFGTVAIFFLTFLFFIRDQYTTPFRRKLVLFLIIMLILLAALSTSSAAYAGLAVFFALAAVDYVFLARHRNHHIGFELTAIYLVIILICLSLLLFPQLFEPVYWLLDTFIFSKTDSSSFDERSFWTSTALNALVESGFVGVGVGSARTSNGAAAILSNTGVLGALFYYGFVFYCMVKPTRGLDPRDRSIVTAARLSYIPLLVIELLVSTVVDFGTSNAFRWALILGILSYAPAGSHKLRHSQPRVRQGIAT